MEVNRAAMSVQKKETDKRLEGLSIKERNEILAEQKEERKWRVYGVIAVVVIALIAALLFWDHGFIQSRATAVTIGEKSYSAADVDYYYYSQYNTMYAYASYYGIDTSKSLKEQEAYDGQTWYEYLRSNAESSLREVSTLAQQAEAAGYTISEDGQKNIDDMLANVEKAAKTNNVSQAYYLRRMFGRFMTMSRFEKIITEYFYAYDYQASKTEGFEVSEDEIKDYYKEHKDELDTFDFAAYKVNVETETDEDGNEIPATEEQIAAAKKGAEQLKDALKDGDQKKIDQLVSALNAADYSDVVGANLGNFAFGKWLTSSDRKKGDVTVIEDAEASSEEGSDQDETSVTGYFAVKFNSRKRDEYKAGSLLAVSIPAEQVAAEPADGDSSAEAESEDAEPVYDMEGAKAAADAFVKTWLDNGGTEEALRQMTTDSSAEEEEEAADSSAEGTDSAAPTYVLSEFESVSKESGALPEEAVTWLYSGEHNVGDCTVVEDADANRYLVICFNGYDELPYWQETAKSAIQSDKYTEWYEGIQDKYEPTETWFFSQVG